MPRFVSQPYHGGGGNISTLTKVDKLRELIGTRIALPQLVVVGDQSAGKSSVLEGITGFAFPRAAELCTRYCTQITCRREAERKIDITIIPHHYASLEERIKMREFQETLTEITTGDLATIFQKANNAMGIRTIDSKGGVTGSKQSAFSEHILKIEICGPDQDHFTVIDVPGIFRRETAGLTTEEDIALVLKMVKNHMKDERTIILAIIPSNTDPATQEILKLAKGFDPKMTRTMGVLTKPELNIERATQQIAIDHVIGRRSDLTLGYYIVKNRGADHMNQSLEVSQKEEIEFFASNPWSSLRSTGRAGIGALKSRVRELLESLIKKEFPKLKAEVAVKLAENRIQREAMGLPRGSPQAQRVFLSSVCSSFEQICRDALNANYTSNASFFATNGVRLMTRVINLSETFTAMMWEKGHTHKFGEAGLAKDTGTGDKEPDQDAPGLTINPSSQKIWHEFPVSTEICDIIESEEITPQNQTDIMDYIKTVYDESRGMDLGTFGGSLLGAMFKHQSMNWEAITMDYLRSVVAHVHHFVQEALKVACPDRRVREELWNDYLLDEVLAAYRRATNHAKFLLRIERESRPFTLNHYFNDRLQKSYNKRLATTLEAVGDKSTSSNGGDGVFLSAKHLETISADKAHSQYMQEQIHDILQSYYAVAMKRFVDVVFQQAIDYFLLTSEESPLKIFCPDMVMNFSEEQLDMITGEDASVKAHRAKLDRDIADFGEALKVLKGWK